MIATIELPKTEWQVRALKADGRKSILRGYFSGADFDVPMGKEEVLSRANEYLRKGIYKEIISVDEVPYSKQAYSF